MRRTWWITVTLLWAAHAASAQNVAAAARNPIYPVYEGYTALGENGYALVFGYYNGHPQPIEIEAGESNSFSPGAADLGHTIRFLPGRQRNVCVVLVPVDYTENLRWSITYGGETTTTTERGGVDPLYLLEAINSAQRAVRAIDLGSTPRGVCVNGAPFVRAGADLETRVGVRVELTGFVADDGLPREASLVTRWSVVGDPEGVVIEDASSRRTAMTASRAGRYVVELRADDSELEGVGSLTVLVEE